MLLNRDKIIGLLEEFGELLKQRGGSVIINIYGGAAMAILYSDGRMSEDIDVMLGSDNYFEFKEARGLIAEKYGLRENWINDAVAGAIAFDMKSSDLINFGVFGNLYINIVSAEQLLAMKLFSSRDDKDFEDAVLLAEQLGLYKKKDFNGLLRRYFKDNSVNQRNKSKNHYNGINDFIKNLVNKLNKKSGVSGR